jgi:hypothetical protein
MPESVPVDAWPYGSHAPGALDRFALALTRAMPNNWLGLRLAMLFRRIVTMRLGRGALDTQLWGMRLRLYALGNGCEKNALFTPQMFDVMERGILADAIGRKCDGFSFIDIGANVGLYSLFVASRAPDARILAIEPQPGILDRPALQSRRQSGCQSRCAADGARRSRGYGRACPRHERQRRHAYRDLRPAAKPA